MSFTLLWVEDDPDDILLGGRALIKGGFEKPQIVRDGEDAIAYLSGKAPFDDRAQFPMPSLVLLDLKLPRKSGIEVLKWIRGMEGLKRIPVVILTSSRERHDIDRAYDTGANAYLVKPVEHRTFTEVVRGLHLFWATLNTRPEATFQSSSK
ncbi:MAG TPA: response regulator [Planctomycetota bacterium]